MTKKKKTPDPGETAGKSPLPWWQQRRGVFAIGAIVLATLLITLAGHSWPLLVDHFAVDGSLLLLWLLAAAGYGSLFGKLTPSPGNPGEGRGEGLPPQSPRSSAQQLSPHPNPSTSHEYMGTPEYGARGLRAITQLALGLGILSTLQLLLGLAGLLHQLIAFAVIALGVALIAIRLRPKKIKAFLTAPAKSDWLWLLTLPILAMATVAAYVPPGLLWGDEPNGYDVLEYHLQIPREWYELGRIVPLHHNVFSYFPQGMEMHYLLAMQLRAGPWTGMYLAQLMHVTMIALTILAIYATARLFAPKLPAILAAITAAYIPWLTLLAPVAYNEGALLLFGTLAIGWTIHLFHSPEKNRSALIAGLLTGFACATKLTAVPQLLILLLLLILILPIFSNRPSFKHLLVPAFLFLLTATITFSPWLIRNTIWTHNPVFPEAQHLLGHAHFTETQTQRWTIANHLPGPTQRSTIGRLTAAKDQIFADWRYAYLLLPLGFLAAALHFKNPAAKLLLALLLAWLIFWIAFTHLQSRFFTLAIPLAAISLALLQSRRQRAILYTAATLQILIGGALIVLLFNDKVAPIADKSVLTFEDLSKLIPDDDIQAALAQPDAPLALIGDAKAFLYQVPSSRLHYKTVFDVNAAPNESILDAWLQGASTSAIKIVDPSELDRFSKTYYGIPPLPENFPGPRDHPFVMPR